MSSLFLLLVLAVAIAAVVYAVLDSQRKKGKAPGAPTVAELKTGYIVRYRMLPENNFTVTGFIDYKEDGSTWREVRLVDGNTVRWLEIEEEDFEVELTLWREIDLGVSVAKRIPEQIDYNGHTYRQQESGQARAVFSGQTGKRQQYECRYWDYQSVDGSLLSIEQWGSEFEVSLGERIRASDLDIFSP